MRHQANAMIKAGGAELVALARAGDRDAFAALYRQHHPGVLAYLHTRTRDRHLAEDLTSETFLRALRRIDTFEGHRAGGGVAAWLTVIARNAHLDYVKSARCRLEVPVGEMPDGDDWDRSAEAGALRGLDIAEAAETVTTAMQDLNPYQRECIALRWLEGLSVPETAARLGKSIGATKTLQHRAVQQMRGALTAEAVAA